MFAILGLLAGLLGSDPTVVESTEYYDVRGTTANELLAAINRWRPSDSDGVRRDAVLGWHMSWKFQYEAVPDGCRLTSLTTTLNVVTTLPRWTNPQKGSDLLRRWNRYVGAMEEHERGHRQIALRGAQTVQDNLSGVTAARTCPALKAIINSRGQTLVDQIEDEQDDFDRKTKHGAAQGVAFP